MVDFYRVGKGMTYFLFGFFYTLILSQLAYPLIETMNELFTNTTMEGILWVMIIFTWGILTMILPLYYIIEGITTQETYGKLFGITGAVLYLIIGIFLSITMWYWVDPLVSVIDGTTILVMFWIGLTLTWVTGIIIAPIMHIIQEKSQ